MPTDIIGLGIGVDTRGVSAADIALDRLAKAAIDATSAVQRMTAAAAANSAQGGTLAKQVITVANAHNTLAVAANRATTAHHAHGGAMMQNRMAMMEYEHSIRSVIDGLSAGMSPLRLFAMEGARLAQANQMGGGASGAMQMFGGIIGKLMSPTVALTGAVVALGAGGVYAFDSWQERLNALQQSLNGLGRSTGLTLGGLNQVAMQSAGGRTSTFQAQSAIAAMAATGRISPDIMRQLVAPQPGQSQGLVQQYSQATGASFSESVQKLASDFADPTKGAAELNKEFLLLGDNEMQLIVHMDAAGNRLGAQGKLLDDLRGRIQGAADVTSIWARTWDGVSTAAANATAHIGHLVSGPSPEEALAAIRARNAATAARGGHVDRTGLPLSVSFPGQGAADIAEERRLGDIVASNALAASWTGFQQVANEKSLDIGEITRRTNPDIDRLQKLTDDRDKLQAAMDTPGALGKTDRNAAQESLDRLNAGVKNFGTTAQIVARDSAAASAATMATTATQRTAIQAFKAWSDVVREGGGYALAAAQSTARWNEGLVEAKRALDDETRATNVRGVEPFMNPLDREIYENHIRANKANKDTVHPPDLTTPDGWPGGAVSALDRSMTALDTGGLIRTDETNAEWQEKLRRVPRTIESG